MDTSLDAAELNISSPEKMTHARTALSLAVFALGITSLTAALNVTSLMAQGAAPRGKADLSVTMAGATGITHGQSIAFTVTAKNAGPSAAKGAVVYIYLGNGLRFDPAGSDTGCQEKPVDTIFQIVCEKFDLAKNATKVIRIQTKGVSNDLACNATLSSSARIWTGSTEDDPVAGNNGAQSPVYTRIVCEAVSRADLSLTLTGDATVMRGKSINFSMTAKNAGPSPASDSTAYMYLAQGLRFDPADSDSACTEEKEGDVFLIWCEKISLENNATKVMRVRAKGTGDFACNATVSNGAWIYGSQDANTENNSAKALSTRIACDGVPVPRESGTAVCGNGNIGEGEECDDSNRKQGDGCSASCKKEVCGDKIVSPALGEQCDYGNKIDGDGCSKECKFEYCGNGKVEERLKEKCDDGNNIPGDGCSKSCKKESLGDRTVTRSLGEECDDGNATDGDGCNAKGKFEYCGDNVLQKNLKEQCDDGNVKNGDGCDWQCKVGDGPKEEESGDSCIDDQTAKAEGAFDGVDCSKADFQEYCSKMCKIYQEEGLNYCACKEFTSPNGVVCNKNGICESDSDETTQTCETDCGSTVDDDGSCSADGHVHGIIASYNNSSYEGCVPGANAGGCYGNVDGNSDAGVLCSSRWCDNKLSNGRCTGVSQTNQCVKRSGPEGESIVSADCNDPECDDKMSGGKCTGCKDESGTQIACGSPRCDKGPCQYDDPPLCKDKNGFKTGCNSNECFGQGCAPGGDMALSVSVPQYHPKGQPIPYTVTIKNNGPQEANHIYFGLRFPWSTGFTLQDSSEDARCFNSLIDCGYYYIGAGKSKSFVVRVNAPSNIPCNKTYTTHVSFWSDRTRDPNLLNNSVPDMKTIIMCNP